MFKSFIIITLLILYGCEKSSERDYALKFYGDALEDIGYSISITSGGYYIGGQLNIVTREEGLINTSLSNKNLAVIKTDWNGDEIWKVDAGGKYDDRGRKIYQLADGSVLCLGTFTDTTTSTPGETDIFLVKISASGGIQWQKTYGGAGNQTGIDILQMPEGFIILGSSDVERPPSASSAGNIGGKTDFLVIKVSESGELLSSIPYGFPNNDLGAVIKNAIGGNFMILGTTEQSDPAMDKNNLLLVKINNTLDVIESKILGDAADEYAADMEVIAGGYLISGTIGKETDVQEAFIRTVSQNIQASQAVPVKFKINNTSTSVKAMAPCGTDGFVLCGQSGPGSSGEMLVIKTDISGNPVQGKTRINGSTGLQIAYDVTSGDDGYIIAVGRNSYENNSLISMIKFKF